MSIVLELPADLEAELNAEAAELGVPLSQYVVRLLSAARNPLRLPRSSRESVAYWQNEGAADRQHDTDELPNGPTV